MLGPKRLHADVQGLLKQRQGLSRLTQLPINELKIDRSFMRDLESNDGTRAIVTAVIRVGQSLNLAVVAEGVETAGQRQLLSELGCEAVQGFLHARPMPSPAFGRWLLGYSARRAGVMLRQVGRSLVRTPSPSEQAVDQPAVEPRRSLGAR